jgi:hypothetical protein
MGTRRKLVHVEGLCDGNKTHINHHVLKELMHLRGLCVFLFFG